MKPTDNEVKTISRKIKHKLNIAFLLMRAVDTFMWDIDNDLRKTNKQFGLSGPIKQRINQLDQKVQACSTHFYNFIEPIIDDATSLQDGDYDKSREFAQELMRLVMCYYETCLRSNENHSKVFDLLSSFEDGAGIFDAEDINKFDLGTRKG